MDKIVPFSDEQRKLMKSFFSLQTVLKDLRTFSPSVMGTVSVEEFYDIFIEIIDVLIFGRKDFIENLSPNKNPGMKEVNPSPSNVGGLIQIRFPRKMVPAVPLEIELLREVQILLIKIKRALVKNQTLPKFKITEEGPKQVNRKNRNVKKHFYYLRKKKK